MNRMMISVVGLVALAGLSCTGAAGGDASGGGSVSGEASSGGAGGLGAGCDGDFGTTAAASKLETFLSSTATFVTTADQLANTLTDTCRRMGSALGIPDAEMAPSGDTPPQRAACDRVAQGLHDEFAALRGASAGIRVDVVATPPVCQVSLDAYAQCAAQCDASYQPGSAELQCEGGEIRGTCDAQCTGSCAADVNGQCAGACEGTCSGGCTGTCTGTCEGTCATRGADGQCAGRCNGTCRGTCSAGCTGGCQGQCVVQAQAQCSGECRGGCSVHMREPRCTGHVVPPQVSAECRASCDARLNAQATCRPGRADVVISGGLSGDTQARADRLRAAIAAGYATIQVTRQQLELLAGSGQAMVQTAGDIPGAIRDLGLGAAACVASAGARLPRATASVSVSVQVSASVSGSVSGG